MRSLLVALALMLVGCVRFQPQPISSTETAARLDARRLDDAGLKKFVEANAPNSLQAWPPVEWDLNSLALVAFYFHPSLEVARAQWRVAQKLPPVKPMTAPPVTAPQAGSDAPLLPGPVAP